MIIQLFFQSEAFPEFHFGRREGKLFVEMEPGDPPSGVFYKGKKLAYSLANSQAEGLVVRRYQITKPGTYGFRFEGGEKGILRISLQKGSDNLYDFVLGGGVRINGIKLSSLSQKEEVPSVGPTLWERLDA
jgi:hypothetical protein